MKPPRSQKQNAVSRRLGREAVATGRTFRAGVSGNPGGKPVGARNRLQGDFLRALADDFEQHGRQAIVRMREEDPSAYVRTVASLMPKELEVRRPLEDLSDEELFAAVEALRAMLTQQHAADAALQPAESTLVQ